MKKLKMESLNMTQCNIEKIGALFPQVITEAVDDNGKLVKAIDFEKLRQELSSELLGDGEESYDFTWVGKNQAIVEANEPIRKTLRPVVETETVPTGEDSDHNPYCSSGSKNFDATENLYIEGDNLDVLKLLQESYLSSIKMIYIDPPYNTGKDSFVYPDNHTIGKDDYEEQIEYRNEDGEVVFKQNNETNARFHSDWCSMIYMRLKLARNLLTDDGVIFISIDDNEVENLKKLCDELFGENNFVADLIWTNKEGGGSSDSKLFRIKHEHIVCYAKNIFNLAILGTPITNAERYKSFDEYVSTRGNYYLQKLGMGSIQYSKSLDYPIETPDGQSVMPADNNNGKKACWRWSKSKFEWGMKNGFVEMKRDNNGTWIVYTKQYMKCDNEGNLITRTQRPMGIIDEYSSTQASKFLDSIELGSCFDYSKPYQLISYLMERVCVDNGIVLDFFSGSATIAQAVMQLNADDGGNRKYICVQLAEQVEERKNKVAYEFLVEANKACVISEIAKVRIRRAGEKIKAEIEAGNAQLKIGEESKQVPDIGFRVLKVDSTNMKDVYYGAEEITQTILGETLSNIKEDRTGLDLLYGVLLDWGLELSSSCETLNIDGVTVYNYDDASLVACLEDKKVSETAIREIAKMQPTRVVFRDSSFESSPDKINVEEIFKLTAPGTSVKVI